jgi:predicted RNA-binding protein YlxR (DUF448 family)
MIRLIKKYIKQRHCKHEHVRCITNFYGDMINYMSTHHHGIVRSVYICKDCDKILYSSKLNKSCHYSNFKKENDYGE